jgi:hypothetical protein
VAPFVSVDVNDCRAKPIFPDYHPEWIVLDRWHIGAQYFMGLCFDRSDCRKNWIAKAATGKLILVEEGEVIETSFSSVPVEGRFEWHLRIGVQDDPSRRSIVVADRPFMGLLENVTKDWMEDRYKRLMTSDMVGVSLSAVGLLSPTSVLVHTIHILLYNMHIWKNKLYNTG